jgi:choline dehydrogenase-like flavoprotein
MRQENYDAIVIGSGAGGSAAAYRLVKSGMKVLLVEKGDRLSSDGSTLDVGKVITEGRFKSRETWRDGKGRALVPEEYFNVGGKTKWYGAALLRFSAEEFAEDRSRSYRGWPITAADLEPYYDEVEKLLGVREFACEADLARIIERLPAKSGWRAEPLPMGLAPSIVEHPHEARHFDGFASVRALKSDAETALLSQVAGNRNLEFMTGSTVVDLLGAAGNSQSICGVVLANGQVLGASRVLLAGGALHSPRILQRYLERNKIAQQLPAFANVGRNLKLHLLTAVLAISASRKTDLLRKTTLLLNERYPRSSVQPLGFDGELIANLVPRFVPRWFARQLGERAYGFFLQTEDGTDAENRIADSLDVPLIDYSADRSGTSLCEHHRLVRGLRVDLARAGYLSFAERIPVQGTAHACGTLVAGNDPATSVVDARGRVHGLQGLYVVDGSILPRSSRVNPSLTIYAWAFRVADGLIAAQRAAA